LRRARRSTDCPSSPTAADSSSAIRTSPYALPIEIIDLSLVTNQAVTLDRLQQELIVKENGPRTKDFLNPDLPEAASDEPVNPVTDPNAAGPSLRKHSIDAEYGEEEQGGASPVLLVCNLRESVTCDNLFNLFSCYGNVVRIKKLSSKPVCLKLFTCSGHASDTRAAHTGPRVDPVLEPLGVPVGACPPARVHVARPLARDQLFQALVHLHASVSRWRPVS
jgi:hypothetical protein